MAKARLKRVSPQLFVIFLSNVLLMGVIFLAISVGTWNLQTWEMTNKRFFEWELTLHRIFPSADCGVDESFSRFCYAMVMMSLGSLVDATRMICGASYAKSMIPEDLVSSLDSIKNSCGAMQRLEWCSLATFVLLLLTEACLIASFLSLLKWCAVSFGARHHRWYGLSVVCMVASMLLTGFAAVIYTVGPDHLSVMFKDLESPAKFEPVRGGIGICCWGFWLVVGCFIFQVPLVILWTTFVPYYSDDASSVEPEERTVVRGCDPKRVGSRKAFWAYTPDTFNVTSDYPMDHQTMYCPFTDNASYSYGALSNGGTQLGSPYASAFGW